MFTEQANLKYIQSTEYKVQYSAFFIALHFIASIFYCIDYYIMCVAHTRFMNDPDLPPSS